MVSPNRLRLRMNLRCEGLAARPVARPFVRPERREVLGHEGRPVGLELREEVGERRGVEGRGRVAVLRPRAVVELGPEPVEEPAEDGLIGGPDAPLLRVAERPRPLLRCRTGRSAPGCEGGWGCAAALRCTQRLQQPNGAPRDLETCQIRRANLPCFRLCACSPPILVGRHRHQAAE